MRTPTFALIVVCALASALASAAASATTVDRLPIGNGIGVATLRVDDGRLDGFFEASYAALDQGLPTPQLLFDAYIGARVAGSSRWLTVAPTSIDVVDDANVYTVHHREGALDIATTVIGPFGLDHPAVLVRVAVENTGPTAVTASFPTLANFHVGSGDGTRGEQGMWDPAKNAIIERGTRTVAAFAIGATAGHTMTPQNPFPIVEQNLPFPTGAGSVDDSGVVDDVVHGFLFSPAGGSLAAGGRYSFGMLYAAPSSQSFFADVARFVGTRSADQIVDDELAASRAFVASARLPAGLSVDERTLAGVQLALLRAAQVRDRADGGPRRRENGQIVASLPPGIWNITWVRDLAYATRGLLDAGKDDEAEAALRFVLDGDAGEYADYVGSDYLVSVTRYFGGGREESDSNAGGPNVEWDDFGLFLQVYAEGLARGLPVDDRLDDVKAGVADVLLSLIGEDDLLVPDSSIWETHWEPTFESQGRQQFTYSSSMAAAGLQEFADALALRGDPTDDADATRYAAAAARLRAAVRAQLVDDDLVLAACKEELTRGSAYLDAAVVEAFNRDVVDDGAVIDATLDALQALAADTGGYIRNDAGGEYDAQEWLVVDLWMSKAMRRAGRGAEADRLVDHVTARGLDELGLIPELISPEGIAAGAFPMMGFGAGAYLTALHERADAVGEGEGEGEAVIGEGEGEGEAVVGEGEGEGEGAVGEGEGEAVGEGEGEAVGEGEGDDEPAGEGEGEGDAGGGREPGLFGCSQAATAPAPVLLLGLILLQFRMLARSRRSRS